VPGGEEYPSLVRWGDRERDVLTEPMDKIDDEIIACLLSEREYAIRGEEIAGGLFAAVEEVAELPDGYGFRFAGDGGRVESLLELIAAERRCCPFLSFELAFEPHGGPLWLRMRGSPPVKAFIAEAFTSRVADPAGTGASQDQR
jgi:hypothetical protein